MTAERVERHGDGIRLTVTRGDERVTVDGDCLLVAVGRTPNGDVLGVDQTGVAADHGRVLVDDTFRTNVEGIWAFGDLVGRYQLKHCANQEGRIVAHNVCHPDDPQRASTRPIPHAVFSSPQIASIGPTEAELRDAGRPYVVAQRRYSGVAYGWALEDTSSFVKVLGDPERRTLLGAHIIGPDASTLIQPLVQALYLDTPLDAVAHDVVYIHPALTEVDRERAASTSSPSALRARRGQRPGPDVAGSARRRRTARRQRVEGHDSQLVAGDAGVRTGRVRCTRRATRRSRRSRGTCGGWSGSSSGRCWRSTRASSRRRTPGRR